MVILITGASHTGKTNLAQKILEKYNFNYLSIDHLKMGLIRSGNTTLTPYDDEELTEYLWEIVKEIIKTIIENNQNIVIEGSYIPFNWKDSFTNNYLKEIKYYCLIMTEQYIINNFNIIKEYSECVENRHFDSSYTKEFLIKENTKNLEMCNKFNCNYIIIDDYYPIDFNFIDIS